MSGESEKTLRDTFEEAKVRSDSRFLIINLMPCPAEYSTVPLVH